MRVVTHTESGEAAGLELRVGQHSDGGVKGENEDACGIRIPAGELLLTKGAAAVVADGMSGAEAGREAAETCVQGFLADYYSTPESWSVKRSGSRVLGALNRWLYGRGQRQYGGPRGLVSTLSALVIKSSTAHLFHVGDSRIHRLQGGELEALTRDHQVQVAGGRTYLARAVGIDHHLDIDYRTVAVERGDCFCLTTDGVHEVLGREALAELLTGHLPYGKGSATRSPRQWRYRSLLRERPDLPRWLDRTLERAVHPDPRRRPESLSELVHGLGHPNPADLDHDRPPLLERDPVAFWRALTALLAATSLTLLYLWLR